MIEVFKTNVSEQQQADKLIGLLLNLLPNSNINFDLEDCDKVLRINHEMIEPDQIIGLLISNGFDCRVME
ncbi:MAG: hypothetical protein H6550_14360 [Chitinophagales bacterium]|nr:hypothetical protein [Chitinophagales bacterium]